ncbi:MAG: enterotoxin [Pelomonas sp.]|nr:enterotoxin [Roseateles sp.]
MLLATAQARADATLPEPWLPLAPGAAHCEAQGERATLADAALRFELDARAGQVRPARLVNGFTQREQALAGELFSLTLRGKPGGGAAKALAASQFKLDGALACTTVAAQPGAARAAERRAGVALSARFVDAEHGLTVGWRAVLRDGTNYVHEELTLLAQGALDVASIKLVDLELDHPWVAGTTDGSPLVSRDEFFGFEHPMAQAQAIDGRATAWLKRVLPLRAGVAAQYSAVLGAAPAGQLRRGFQAYLENERATPFRTFLHYNSWYDIGYFTPYTESEAVGVIKAYGDKLVKARGVRMDSFLFDDGWDDHAHLWQFSKDFPNGFTPVRAAAEAIGAEPGVWLSPWGGYGDPREERLAAGRAGGYEVDDQGLALSGPKYFPLFHDAALGLLQKYGINQFKLDGTGSPDKVTPGSEFDSDFAAAIALIGDLRAVKPDLFINLTTGTWPSPFWLRTADSIWRGGEDHSFAGVGTNRQRWITYRDSDTYGGIVRQGPLFPLNSLMLHGMIYARKARGLNTDPQGDFADEVHSYFATGTGLQEMYVSPDLLGEKDWDTLAGAAKWARANAATLRDSHWIGGDPARGEVYGWASWSPGHAIVTLRNPGAAPQRFALDLAQALELPASEPRAWVAKPAFGAGAALALRAGAVAAVELKPFEVQVLELSPAAR